LNSPEKRKKAWYNSYVIKLKSGLNHDLCGLGFSSNGNVPTLQNSHRLKMTQNNPATLPVYSYDTEDSPLDAR